MEIETSKSFRLICGHAHPELGARLAAELGVQLTVPEITSFADGETRIFLPDQMFDATLFILQPTCTPVNENLMALALIVDAARAANARRIIALAPYFGYARQERRGRIGEPRSAQVAAKLLGAVGLDHLVVIDLHAAALESAFPFSTTMLNPEDLFRDRIRSWELNRPVVVAPDAGGVKRAQRIAMQLSAPLAVVKKHRASADAAVSLGVLGDVRGRNCVVVDDIVSTGRTLAGAAEVLSKAGATSVHVVFTHAVMGPGAMERLAAAPISRMLTSDSIPVVKQDRLEVVSTATMLAKTMCSLCGISGPLNTSNKIDKPVVQFFRAHTKRGKPWPTSA